MRVTPTAAQALGMAFHELATNAAKYGALANDTGQIRLRWSVTDEAAASEFRMTWSEEGGPPVSAPKRTGFGRTVMERMIASTLGGTAALEFAPGGIVWTFACPSRQALEGVI